MARRKLFLAPTVAAIVLVGTSVVGAIGTATAATRQVTPPNATFTYPAAGQQNVDAINPFRWAAVPGAQAYDVAVGTHRFGTDIAVSGVLPGTQTSFRLGGLPTGTLLYATLLTWHGGPWGSTEVTFLAAPGDFFAYPTNGQTNVDVSKPLTWNVVPASQGSILVVGFTRFTSNAYNSGLLPAGKNAVALPFLTGRVFATLVTKTNGGYTRYQEIAFTAAPAHVTIVNSYPLAVNVSLDGQNFSLAPGQHVGPVDMIPPAPGNDNTNISVAGDPGCGVGDDYQFFDSARSYTFTIVADGGTCANGMQGPNFTITPT